MRGIKTFEAYWDGPSMAQVYLRKNYYEGITDTLTLVAGDGQLIQLDFEVMEASSDYIIYGVMLPALSFESRYDIEDDRGLKAPLEFGRVVRSQAFDDFFYTDAFLGAKYTKKATTFSVWAPTADAVQLMILDGQKQERARAAGNQKVKNENTITLSPMIYTEKGVWTICVPGNLELTPYRFLVKRQACWYEAIDPYAVASLANNSASVVIDSEKLHPKIGFRQFDNWQGPTSAIIYETSVRDMTSSTTSACKDPGTFKGFVGKGLEYIATLGVSHIQLLPIYDFGSVDETNPKGRYNWGYDPVQYRVPEGSFSDQVSDPYNRIVSLQAMITAIHSKGMGVIMDVVYNHMFDKDTSSFEGIVPGYFFRTGTNGELSNGSFCGNDLDSTRSMMRRYILDATAHWMTLYGIDGFRFDLMGILDIETMNQVTQLAKNLNPQTMIYGEGWHMPTLLDPGQMATLYQAEKMPDIGFFNDFFRDTIKGATMADQVKKTGYLTGQSKWAYQALIAFLGTVNRPSEQQPLQFLSPSQTINYVECHDNHTLWDKLTQCCPTESVEQRMARQRMINAFVVLSFGVPFIHCGQEWYRTKFGDHNSYRSSDQVNGVNWDQVRQNPKAISHLRACIGLRKTIPLLTCNEPQIIREQVTSHIYQTGMMIISFPGYAVVMNPTKRELLHHLPLEAICILDSDGTPKVSHHRIYAQPLSVMVFKVAN